MRARDVLWECLSLTVLSFVYVGFMTIAALYTLIFAAVQMWRRL